MKSLSSQFRSFKKQNLFLFQMLKEDKEEGEKGRKLKSQRLKIPYKNLVAGVTAAMMVACTPDDDPIEPKEVILKENTISGLKTLKNNAKDGKFYIKDTLKIYPIKGIKSLSKAKLKHDILDTDKETFSVNGDTIKVVMEKLGGEKILLKSSAEKTDEYEAAEAIKEINLEVVRKENEIRGLEDLKTNADNKTLHPGDILKIYPLKGVTSTSGAELKHDILGTDRERLSANKDTLSIAVNNLEQNKFELKSSAEKTDEYKAAEAIKEINLEVIRKENEIRGLENLKTNADNKTLHPGDILKIYPLKGVTSTSGAELKHDILGTDRERLSANKDTLSIAINNLEQNKFELKSSAEKTDEYKAAEAIKEINLEVVRKENEIRGLENLKTNADNKTLHPGDILKIYPLKGVTSTSGAELKHDILGTDRERLSANKDTLSISVNNLEQNKFELKSSAEKTDEYKAAEAIKEINLEVVRKENEIRGLENLKTNADNKTLHPGDILKIYPLKGVTSTSGAELKHDILGTDRERLSANKDTLSISVNNLEQNKFELKSSAEKTDEYEAAEAIKEINLEVIRKENEIRGLEDLKTNADNKTLHPGDILKIYPLKGVTSTSGAELKHDILGTDRETFSANKDTLNIAVNNLEQNKFELKSSAEKTDEYKAAEAIKEINLEVVRKENEIRGLENLKTNADNKTLHPGDILKIYPLKGVTSTSGAELKHDILGTDRETFSANKDTLSIAVNNLEQNKFELKSSAEKTDEYKAAEAIKEINLEVVRKENEIRGLENLKTNADNKTLHPGDILKIYPLKGVTSTSGAELKHDILGTDRERLSANKDTLSIAVNNLEQNKFELKSSAEKTDEYEVAEAIKEINLEVVRKENEIRGLEDLKTNADNKTLHPGDILKIYPLKGVTSTSGAELKHDILGTDREIFSANKDTLSIAVNNLGQNKFELKSSAEKTDEYKAAEAIKEINLEVIRKENEIRGLENLKTNADNKTLHPGDILKIYPLKGVTSTSGAELKHDILGTDRERLSANKDTLSIAVNNLEQNKFELKSSAEKTDEYKAADAIKEINLEVIRKENEIRGLEDLKTNADNKTLHPGDILKIYPLKGVTSTSGAELKHDILGTDR